MIYWGTILLASVVAVVVSSAISYAAIVWPIRRSMRAQYRREMAEAARREQQDNP